MQQRAFELILILDILFTTGRLNVIFFNDEPEFKLVSPLMSLRNKAMLYSIRYTISVSQDFAKGQSINSTRLVDVVIIRNRQTIPENNGSRNVMSTVLGGHISSTIACPIYRIKYTLVVCIPCIFLTKARIH